jgi:hypothetical protein
MIDYKFVECIQYILLIIKKLELTMFTKYSIVNKLQTDCKQITYWS